MIQYWKDEVIAVEPFAPYINHPVHLTFFLLMAPLASEEKIIDALRGCCKNIAPVSLEFDNWHIFKNDAVTGRDTVILPVKKTNTLLLAQQKIASALNIFRQGFVAYKVYWQGEYRQSYQEWGFPFVGDHWLPHVSIGSVSAKTEDIISRLLEKQPVPQATVLNRLSLYKIAGEAHDHLITINLTDDAD